MLTRLINPIHKLWRKHMKKIYRFDCTDNTLSITLEEYQPLPDNVILRVHRMMKYWFYNLKRRNFMNCARCDTVWILLI